MERKPEWLKVRYNQEAVAEVAELMRDLKLNTVCKEANCPNLGECYRKHTATFMLLGNICTRNCRALREVSRSMILAAVSRSATTRKRVESSLPSREVVAWWMVSVICSRTWKE